MKTTNQSIVSIQTKKYFWEKPIESKEIECKNTENCCLFSIVIYRALPELQSSCLWQMLCFKVMEN